VDRTVGRRVGLGALVVVLIGAVSVAVWWPWGDEAGSAEELCGLLHDRGQYAAVVEGFEPSDVAGSLDRLRRARSELGRLRAAAPPEVHTDLDVQLQAVEVLVGALEDVPPGDAAAAGEAVRSVEPELSEVPAAYARLEQWTAINCA
jgi:hypothetical protein